jgi:hypothetical protein
VYLTNFILSLYLIIDGIYEEHICGRPLGITTDNKGFLYVADAYYGIFKINVNSSNNYGMSIEYGII